MGSLFQDGVVDAWYWYEALSGPLGMAVNRADYGLGGLLAKTLIKRITDCDWAPGDFEQARQPRLPTIVYLSQTPSTFPSQRHVLLGFPSDQRKLSAVRFGGHDLGFWTWEAAVVGGFWNSKTRISTILALPSNCSGGYVFWRHRHAAYSTI